MPTFLVITQHSCFSYVSTTLNSHLNYRPDFTIWIFYLPQKTKTKPKTKTKKPLISESIFFTGTSYAFDSTLDVLQLYCSSSEMNLLLFLCYLVPTPEPGVWTTSFAHDATLVVHPGALSPLHSHGLFIASSLHFLFLG